MSNSTAPAPTPRAKPAARAKAGTTTTPKAASGEPGGETLLIAVANQKGGVAKTTTVASLGAALAERGKSVLLVDLDPQGCLTFSLGHNPDRIEASIHEVLLGDASVDDVVLECSEGMALIPATIDLAAAEPLLLLRAGREYLLQRALKASSTHYDVVLFDCPPALGVLTLNAMTASNWVIIPLQCETLAHRGVGQLLRTVADVQAITNPDLRLLGAVATLYDARTTHSRDVLADVVDRYQIGVLNPPIPRTVKFAEASASGRSILKGRTNKGAVAYRELANNILEHLDGAPLGTFG